MIKLFVVIQIITSGAAFLADPGLLLWIAGVYAVAMLVLWRVKI